MTVKYFDRVLETTTTGGTGPLTLLGPLTGFRSFSVAGNGALVGYVIDDTTKWEIGVGTVNVGSPNTLARTTVLASTNSGALENFGSNVKNVRLAPVASLIMGRDEALNFTDLMGIGAGTANAHTVTMPVAPLAYTNGALILYRATVANTAAAVTVNVNGPTAPLGAKSLKINGVDPAIGLFAAGTLVMACYNTATGAFDIINDPGPLTGKLKIDLSTDVTGVLPGAGPARVLSGMQTANNASDAVNDIDFAAGWVTDGVNQARQHTVPLTKQLDAAWALGTNQGGLFTGTKAAATTYHFWSIRRNSDGLMDVGFDTSETGANVPSGWTKVSRIMSIRTTAASATWTTYRQDGDTVSIVPVTEYSGNARTNALLNLSVPTGFVFESIIGGNVSVSGAGSIVVANGNNLNLTQSVNPASAGSVAQGFGFRIMTNKLGQIYAGTTGTINTGGLTITTNGWVDRRGKED